MKTAEIVKIANGWYVTYRYGGQNKGRDFFPLKKKMPKGEKWNGLAEAQKKAKEWTGE